MDESETSYALLMMRKAASQAAHWTPERTNQRAKSVRTTAHLCNHGHKVGGRGLVVQIFTGFDSEDAAVPVDGELGERRRLIMCKQSELTHLFYSHLKLAIKLIS